jgi:uncharacterized protein
MELTMKNTIVRWIASSLIALSMLLSQAATGADAAAPTKRYLYVLRLAPRLHDPKAWTDADNATVNAHFLRLQEAVKARKVLFAGRTDEPFAETFGIVVFEADSDAAAQAFMQADPTVAAGVMTATLHPFALALLRP